MPFTITLPKLSPTMESGVLVKWHKKVGDAIQPGDLLIEVATDKATVEYNALDEGVIRAILVSEGQEAQVNQPIAICTETATESIEGYQPEGVQPTPLPPAAVSQEPEAAARAPSAAAPSSRAPSSTVVLKAVPPLKEWHPAQSSSPVGARRSVSPYAKKLAIEKGLNPETARGTGPGGRVIARDLETAQPEALVQFASSMLPTTPPGTYVQEPLTPMRRVIAERLQASKQQIPHFYVSIEVDAEPMARCRSELAVWGVKVTFNDLVMRAAALALRHHPEINSGFDGATDAILRFQTIDIAVAVSLPQGLVTPIVRHADYKSLGELSAEVKHLATKAKEGKLLPEEYQGGSFTVSNLGMFGVSEFGAILNPPQAAILAVAAIREEPVVTQGSIVPGKRLTLTLSVDHRVIDGAQAAQFLKSLKTFLEAPTGLCLL